MKKLSFLLLVLCLCLSAYGQQLVSVTPAPFAGTSGNFTFVISNPLPAQSYYYFSFVNANSILNDILPPSSCTIAVTYWPPVNSVVQVASYTNGWNTGAGPAPDGSFTPLDAGFWPDFGPVSNGVCTVASVGGGSSEQLQGNGTLRITLHIDFSPNFFPGPKHLFFGSRSQYASSMVWSAPVNQNGTDTWNIGTFGGGFGSGTGTVTLGGNDYPPTCSLLDMTPPRDGQNAYFQVGDYYQFNVTGPPYAPVVVTRTVDGFDAGTLNFTLDGNGNLAPGGAFDASAIGFWTEQWIVNGYATPILSWAVVPASGAPVLSFLNITPGPRYGTTNYVVGETYHYDLAGAPGAVIWKGCVFNGAPCSGPLPPNLAMPSNGHWTFDGVIQPSDVGIQVESWMVGGVPAGPPITLTVLPQ